MSIRELFSSIRGRRPLPQAPQSDPHHSEIDLVALQTLRKKYSEYSNSQEGNDKEMKLFQLVPLFNKCCGSITDSNQLTERFPEVFDFAENIAFIFVRHITQLAQTNSTSLLEYFEADGDNPSAGISLLKAIGILSKGQSTLVNSMMTSNLSCVILRCLFVFLELPPTKMLPPSSMGKGSSTPFQSRIDLHKLFIRVINKLLRHKQAVEDLLKYDDLSLLFSAMSSPCASHNRIWKKALTEGLLTICKYSLTDDVISYINKKSCIHFFIRNIKTFAEKQPPLDLTETLVALTCCLKDSSEFTQRLIDDFSSAGGYQFFFEYLLQLDNSGEQEAKDALRHIVLLVSDLVSCGHKAMDVVQLDPGPFNPGFNIPEPLHGATSVRNKDAFLVLHNAFLHSRASHLGKDVIDAIINIYKRDPANFFVLEPLHTLSSFLEIVADKNEDVQNYVFRLLDYVVVELNYVPTDAITSVGLLLEKFDYPRTQCMALNNILKFISHKATFKDIYREAGILQLLVETLKHFMKCVKSEMEMTEQDKLTNSLITDGPLNSPSLPLTVPETQTEECVFLVMECLRATIEGNDINGRAFREAGGSICVMEMINISKYRRMALRLITQLVLLEEGYVHMGKLLDMLNTAHQVAVSLRSDILQTILGVFQLDTKAKALFRDGCGFNYLISVLSSLYGSLGPQRGYIWEEVPKSDILHLIQLVFTVLTVAMQDDPANKLFFETNIQFDTFSAPLRLLGCFSKDIDMFRPLGVQLSTLQVPHLIDLEYHPLAPPSTELYRDSFIYCEAEIFRYLRDMALGIPLSQSKPLLKPANASGTDTVGSSATPILQQHSFDGQPKKFYSGYLVHPGAVLCMIDLLPAIDYDAVVDQGAFEAPPISPEEDEEVGMEHLALPAVVLVKNNMGGATTKFNDEKGREWCLYLQDCIVRQIYSIASTERNQQTLCQVGLPGKLLTRCGCGLFDETHPLHEALERTFEKLSYQSLTPADFRNFLRLGSPLSCNINDFTEDQLLDLINEKLKAKECEEAESDLIVVEMDVEKVVPVEGHKVAQPLSLARIQSLVSMTTPRDGMLYGGSTLGASPPFIEFDMSLDGFGCLFLPSLFPQTVTSSSPQSSTAPPSATTGYGGPTERSFPPSNGLSFSLWFSLTTVSPTEPHPINLLTISQSFLTIEKNVANYPLFRIHLKVDTTSLIVSTQIPKERRDSLIEDYIHKDDRKEKNLQASFSVPGLCQGGMGVWHHVVVVMQVKGLRGKAKVSVFVDGKSVGQSQKIPPIHPLPLAVSSHFLPFPSENSPFLINAHIGTHVDNRHISPLVYRIGPAYLFDDSLSPMSIHRIHQLGPLYVGSFQNPSQGNMSAGGYSEPMGQLVQEEKIVFGLVADRPSNHTLHDLLNTYQYSTYDITTIARELTLSDKDDVTPVTLLSNSALHLIGPSRSIGGVVCGYSGIRTFEPQPLRDLLSAVGGTSVVLGLVAMATNVDSLYAAMKAVVCIVGNNLRAIKEMERTGGFQLLGMLLHSKSSLINSNILHLTFTLVGTVNNEHENAEIPNAVAFRDMLADQSVWKNASEDIQRSLYQHFYDLLTHSNDQVSNAHCMLKVKLIPELLMRLHDASLSDTTIKSLINVINALMSHGPSEDDIRRFGQLLFSLLPYEDNLNENTIKLYGQSSPAAARSKGEDNEVAVDGPDGVTAAGGGVGLHRKKIRLRNLLLDVLMSHFTTERNEFDTKFTHLVVNTLGFDWFMLFCHQNIHIENVIRMLRMIILLMTDPQLKKKFINGDIFGGWAHGIVSVLPEYSKAVAHHNLLFSTRPSHYPDYQLPGSLILSKLLPYNLSSPQIILLTFALLLATPVTEISYSANLDLESLNSIFNITHNSKSAIRANDRLFPEAVYIILSMIQVLIHDKSDAGNEEKGLVVVKFLEGLYHHVPSFKSHVLSSQEFIESLAGSLFPPVYSLVAEAEMSIRIKTPLKDDEDDDFVILTSDDVPAHIRTLSVNDSSQAEVGVTCDVSPAHPMLLRHDSSVVMTIIKLLRIIALDGFKSCVLLNKSGTSYDCPILEQVLEAITTSHPEYSSHYQTAILQAIMKHLEGGNEDINITLRDLGPLNKTSQGLGAFCVRLVEKLWAGLYRKSADHLYGFLKNLVEQALTQPKSLPLTELQVALNKVILYQLSSIPENEPEQKELVDMLCLLSSHCHVIFDETNNDELFLKCLLYRLLMLVFTQQGSFQSAIETSTEEKSKAPTGYVPIMTSSLLKSGANRLWSKILEHKRETMERIINQPLPLPTSSISSANTLTGDIGAPVQLSIGNPAHTKLQNCKDFLNDGSLERAWKELTQADHTRVAISNTGQEKDKGIFRTLLSKKKTTRISERDPILVTEEYVCWQRPQLIRVAHKLEDAMMKKYERHLDYKLRFIASEWARIEHELTRERGLWGPNQPSFLDKWMLDCVEGPSRMRKRLCRDYLFYDHYPSISSEDTKGQKHQEPTSSHTPLYLARCSVFPNTSLLSLPFSSPPSHVAMTTPRTRDNSFNAHQGSHAPQPVDGGSRADILSSLDNEDPVARALFKMIDEPITECYQCARLTGLDSCDGLILFGSISFYMVEGITMTRERNVVDIESATEGSYDPVIPTNIQANLLQSGEKTTIQCTKWSYQQIREVHKRRYLLRHCALEVFSNDGMSLFLIFHIPQRDKIYQKLFSLAQPSDQQHLLIDPDISPDSVSSFFSVITGKKSIVQRWENGEVSNFSYLMYLNTLAGRSYNDLMQYPVFPWIIADYDNSVLDLNDPATFRDLSLPMGAQTSKRLQMFIERYKYFEDPMGEVTTPYYYGTHYCSAMSVASFLVRMEPFTQYFIKLQGGHFDLPDRMFHSIPEAWRSASETNMADIKELIPEFFYLPDFLANSNHFELGVKQNTEILGNVILPPWAKGDPLEYVRVNREALESDYVSAHLHEWIDLIFGYKQQGREAEKHHNLFHPLFYEGTIDIDTIDDSMRRNAVISFIHNFGQMPRQLFKRPHRSRKVFAGTAIGNPTIDPSTIGTLIPQVFFKNIAQLLPSKEPVKIIRGEVGQIIMTPSEKQLLVVEKRKLLLPSGYTRYFSWGYIDHSARIALVEGDKVISVFEGLQQGRILCGSALDDNTLLTAGESTVIYVWSIRNTSSKDKSPTALSLKHTLHGHTGPVTCIATSSSYNLIVTGSKDKTCIVWDSNRLLFVRQLKGHVSAITVVTINQLSGNIVTCTRNELRLWTINGVLLAQAELTITGNFRLSCCAVSEMFEWDSDNVILTGSSDGVVRIWRVEYERRNNVGSSADNYPTTPPSIYPDMEYPTMIYPGRPIKLIKTTHDSTPEGDLPLAESSDTESSEAPPRGTGDDTRGEEQEEPPPMPSNDEIKVERQESQGSTLNQYIEEAKRKADELREKTGYWKRRLILAHTLTMHTSFQRQDNSSPAAITCITISKDHRRLFIGDALGRVFSWSVTDSLGGVMEHWILDEAVNRCMRCNMEFTLTERKHHCRDCGKIFCARCSDFTSEIERLKISKKVRVCLDCYDKLNNS